MCIFANEGGPKSKSSRKETPLKIQKYKEIHVSGKNLEKKFSATTPTLHSEHIVILLSGPLNFTTLISILIFLIIISVPSASWAHMGVQIPLRPPQRRGETRGWAGEGSSPMFPRWQAALPAQLR